MRIGAALFLIAIGAILKFAVTKHVAGVDLQIVGVVLMVIGIVGLLVELVLLSVRRRHVVYGRSGTTYVEPADRADPYL
jgi:Na+/melibiose symporter-like transporter